MIPRIFILVAVFVGCTSLCLADTLKTADKTYENVYITEGQTTYYVCFPDDGTVLNVAKSDVDAKDVSLTEDKEARRALFDKWSEKARERKGLPTSTSIEAAPADDTPVQAPPEVEKPKVVSASGNTGGQQVWSGQAQGGGYVNQAEDWARLQRERNIEARRRQRESEKYRALTQRRVITSEDARSSGGLQSSWNGAGGGFGGGGFGGGGYGNMGMGGFGNRGR